jgi:hypothetical protein
LLISTGSQSARHTNMLFPLLVKGLIIAEIRRKNYQSARRRLESRLRFPYFTGRCEYGIGSNPDTGSPETFVHYSYSLPGLPHLTFVYEPRCGFKRRYPMPTRYYSSVSIITGAGKKVATYVWERHAEDGRTAEEYVLAGMCQRCRKTPFHYMKEDGRGSFQPLGHVCIPAT